MIEHVIAAMLFIGLAALFGFLKGRFGSGDPNRRVRRTIALIVIISIIIIIIIAVGVVLSLPKEKAPVKLIDTFVMEFPKSTLPPMKQPSSAQGK